MYLTAKSVQCSSSQFFSEELIEKAKNSLFKKVTHTHISCHFSFPTRLRHVMWISTIQVCVAISIWQLGLYVEKFCSMPTAIRFDLSSCSLERRPLIFYYGECKLVNTIKVIYGFILNETPRPQLRKEGPEGRRGGGAGGRVEGRVEEGDWRIGQSGVGETQGTCWTKDYLLVVPCG